MHYQTKLSRVPVVNGAIAIFNIKITLTVPLIKKQLIFRAVHKYSIVKSLKAFFRRIKYIYLKSMQFFVLNNQ